MYLLISGSKCKEFAEYGIACKIYSHISTTGADYMENVIKLVVCPSENEVYALLYKLIVVI